MNRLSGKSAVVTGGASGIGRAIAILFAEEGARVTVGDVNERALADLADEPALDEERAEFVHADVSTVGGASNLVEAAQRRFGGPNVLVCNAGITSVMAVERLSEDEWDRVQRNNVKSVYTMVRAALPGMKAAGGGTIVTLGSEMGMVAVPESPAYNASKGAVMMLTRSLALDLIRYGIRVNALYQYGLVVLPALAGAFIGCPLVAREIENGTHRLAWTQGVTRARWLAIKLTLVFIPVLAIAAVVGILELILVNQQGADANHWAFFDQHAPMTVASTLFALALGVAAGAVVGRSVQAMAVTLVAFVVVRIGLAELARPNYIAPLAYTTHDMSNFNSPPLGLPSAWWTDQASFYDSAGHLLSNGGPGGFATNGAAYAIQHYQPADRFWTFQSIESGILVGLAAILIGFAIYWVTRRVS